MHEEIDWLKLVEVRCPKCNKLLFKTDGNAEGKCKRCGSIVVYYSKPKITAIPSDINISQR